MTSPTAPVAAACSVLLLLALTGVGDWPHQPACGGVSDCSPWECDGRIASWLGWPYHRLNLLIPHTPIYPISVFSSKLMF